MKSALSLITLLAITALPLLATAQDQPHVEPPQASAQTRQLSVTVSPIHLVLPLVEVTGEYAISPKIGVAGILGAGSITVETSTLGGSIDKTNFTIYTAGVSGRYYLLGDFDHGMQVGAEATWLGVSGTVGDESVKGTGAGISVGPFIGYKIISNFGLTFDAQLGVQAIYAKAEATDGTTTATSSDMTTGGLLNLNVGWSF